MKQCPSCKTEYADDTLSFCLQDGTPLVALPATQAPTVVFNDEEAQTVVRSPRATEPVNYNTQEEQQTQAAQSWQQQSRVTQLKPPLESSPQAPQKSSTAKAVLVTAIVMLLLFGAGLGAWFIAGKRGKTPPVNKDVPTPTKTPANTNKSPTPSPSASPTASVEPSIMRTPPADDDTQEIKSEVSSLMNDWKASMESGSLDSVMDNYADRLDYYYNAGSVSSAYVRNNKKKAFETYYSFKVNMSGMQITPDASGEKATIVFNKSWVFTGSGTDSKGTVRARFQATKIAGSWYITGEKDL